MPFYHPSYDLDKETVDVIKTSNPQRDFGFDVSIKCMTKYGAS